jgi:hypothetical protein
VASAGDLLAGRTGYQRSEWAMQRDDVYPEGDEAVSGNGDTLRAMSKMLRETVAAARKGLRVMWTMAEMIPGMKLSPGQRFSWRVDWVAAGIAKHRCFGWIAVFVQRNANCTVRQFVIIFLQWWRRRK